MSPERRKKEKLNTKPERKDLRRETLGVTRCLLEVSLLQREVPAPEYSKRKRCGSEQAWDFSTAISLSLSLSLHLSLHSTVSHYHSLALLRFRPRLTSVALFQRELGAGSRHHLGPDQLYHSLTHNK